jgi:hypothetical protein
MAETEEFRPDGMVPDIYDARDVRGFGFFSANQFKSVGWFSIDLRALRMLCVSH